MRFFYLTKWICSRKILLFILMMPGLSGFLAAQENNPQVIAYTPKIINSQDIFTLKEPVGLTEYRTIESESEQNSEIAEDDFAENFKFYKFRKSNVESPPQTFLKPEFQKLVDEIEEIKKLPEEFPNEIPKQSETGKQAKPDEKFHWKPAFKESLYFLGILHGARLFQKKTIREFNGKFFADWGTSVKNLGGWRDGDRFATNYIAHPMQGAATGRIFVNNSEKSRKLEFSKSDEYWKSRFKAMAWSAVWNTQFELGPISEATIGNVGLYDKVGPNRMGWVDLVVTPTAGTGLLIAEDVIDKYILKKWLEKGSSRGKVRILRMFITPFQSFTNVLGGKLPWTRYNRR